MAKADIASSFAGVSGSILRALGSGDRASPDIASLNIASIITEGGKPWESQQCNNVWKSKSTNRRNRCHVLSSHLSTHMILSSHLLTRNNFTTLIADNLFHNYQYTTPQLRNETIQTDIWAIHCHQPQHYDKSITECRTRCNDNCRTSLYRHTCLRCPLHCSKDIYRRSWRAAKNSVLPNLQKHVYIKITMSHFQFAPQQTGTSISQRQRKETSKSNNENQTQNSNCT